jgi:hypothetical protein
VFLTGSVSNWSVSVIFAQCLPPQCNARRLIVLYILLMPHSAGKRNDEENAKEKLYTYATHVPVETFKVSLVLLLLKASRFDLSV